MDIFLSENANMKRIHLFSLNRRFQFIKTEKIFGILFRFLQTGINNLFMRRTQFRFLKFLNKILLKIFQSLKVIFWNIDILVKRNGCHCNEIIAKGIKNQISNDDRLVGLEKTPCDCNKLVGLTFLRIIINNQF